MLEALAEGELLMAVAERLQVDAQVVIGGGEGGVEAEQVVLGDGGGGFELGLEQDDLQPDVGVRPVHGAQDRLGGFLPAGGAAGEHRGQQPLGRGGEPGPPGGEGEQQPPLVTRLAQAGAGLQLAR